MSPPAGPPSPPKEGTTGSVASDSPAAAWERVGALVEDA